MFGLPVLWLVVAGVVMTALAGTHWKAFSAGKDTIRHEWDIDKAERAAAQATADESQRLKGHAAALSYEQDKSARQARTVYVTKEVAHALETDVAWSSGVIPSRVRDAIAAAVGQAPAASQPDPAVRLPAAGGVDQRPVGGGLRLGAGRLGGLFGASSVAR